MPFGTNQVAEMWQDVYDRALVALGPHPDVVSEIDKIIGTASSEDRAQAAAAADLWTSKNVTADEWRAFTNARGNALRRADRYGTEQRQVAAAPKRSRRQDAKRAAAV